MIDYQLPMRNALTPEQREKLEKMREGFPRRAGAVVQYLAGQRDVDFDRIHADEALAAEANSR